MTSLPNGVYYFQENGGYGDTDKNLGYVSIHNNRINAIGKPAKVNQEGSFWMIDGKLHREDGPAVELNTGRKEWWLNGKRHRIGGPAIIFVSGDMHYYQNGKCSRLDGPAIENADGYRGYFIDGKKVEEEDLMEINA